jgi:hypothetical protein
VAPRGRDHGARRSCLGFAVQGDAQKVLVKSKVLSQEFGVERSLSTVYVGVEKRVGGLEFIEFLTSKPSRNGMRASAIPQGGVTCAP